MNFEQRPPAASRRTTFGEGSAQCVDARTEEEKRLVGERRSATDRRSGLDRYSSAPLASTPEDRQRKFDVRRHQGSDPPGADIVDVAIALCLALSLEGV
jgi:hypothetical protein